MNRLSDPLRFEAPEPARFSAAEFLRMAELGAFDDMKVELDHGEIIRMNPPYGPHGAAVADIIVALAAAVRGSGQRVTGEAAILLSDETVYAFDAAVVRGEVQNRPYEPHELLLAVEVAHTSLSRDLGRKSAEYARAGIPNYWVVDVRARAVHVMSEPAADKGYAQPRVVRFGEPLELPEGLGTIILG
jgi:Uma2 family endonuclease